MKARGKNPILIHICEKNHFLTAGGKAPFDDLKIVLLKSKDCMWCEDG